MQQPPRPGAPPQQQQFQQGGYGQKSAEPAQSTRRIDPAHMPRPSRKTEQQKFYTRQSVAQGKMMVPRATDNYVAVDDGNANPRYMRMTLNQYPASPSLLKTSEIPLACIVHPFARLQEGEEEPPVVDLGDNGPTRCSRCRGYINLFCVFNHSSVFWKCNLCQFDNPLPPQYQGDYNSMYGSTAQPELAQGSVDFVVKGEYIVRPPQEPIFLFAVDVSSVAIQTGTSKALLSSLLRLVQEHIGGGNKILGESRARVGILTYAETVQFYDLHSTNDSGHKVLIVSDFDEGFCPLPPNRLVVGVDENGAALVELLESLLSEYSELKQNQQQQQQQQQQGQQQLQHQQQQQPHACISGTAFQAAISGLEPCGGKVVFFVTQAPSFGPGTLKERNRAEKPLEYSTDKENGMYIVTPEMERQLFGELSKKCCFNQISVDIYSFGDDHKDLTSWAIPSNNTGGSVFRFPFLQANDMVNLSKFQATLQHTSRRNTALEAVLKVRSSNGVRVDQYFGTGLKRTRGGELDMAYIDEDNACVAMLDHDGMSLENQKEVYLQCAVLYTTVTGQRRVRVHNLACPVTGQIADIFRNADIDSISNVMARQAISQMQNGESLNKVHTDLNTRTVKILCSYRRNCAKNPTGQQLILPEALKLLPLYVVSMIKNAGLRRNLETLKSHRSAAQTTLVRADERCEAFNFINRTSLRAYIQFTYPILFTVQARENLAEIAFKQNLAPSIVSFKPDEMGAMIIQNGADSVLVVSNSTSPEIYQQMGTQNYDTALQAASLHFATPPGSTQFLQAIEKIVRAETQFPRASSDTLINSIDLVVKGSAADPRFVKYLVEDSLYQLKSMPAYDDFLCLIHGMIQNMMRNY